MYKLVVQVSIFFLVSHSWAQSATEIEFRHVDNPEIIAFAVDHLRGEIKTSSEEEWVAAVKEHALYAEADLNDDGVPERFLQYGSDCGTIGCFTKIYRRIGKLKKNSVSQRPPERFEVICEAMIPGFDPTSWILDQKEHGYHLIDTENGAIIHWKAKKDSAEKLCRSDFKPEP
jgi:hypothetical protein